MKLIKEIVSKKGILHFQRFGIFQSKYFSIYIHKIYKADEDEHCHNHPWNLLTMILSGSYIEKNHRFVGRDIFNLRKRFNIAFKGRKKYHKIQKLQSTSVTTLALVFGKRQDWGYIVNNNHVDQLAYRNLKNNI